jgi:hypothetical protein
MNCRNYFGFKKLLTKFIRYCFSSSSRSSLEKARSNLAASSLGMLAAAKRRQRTNKLLHNLTIIATLVSCAEKKNFYFDWFSNGLQTLSMCRPSKNDLNFATGIWKLCSKTYLKILNYTSVVTILTCFTR